MEVGLYARVSDSKGAEKELSIPGQLRSLREYAFKHGYAVVNEFVDEAETGRTSDRKAFKEMIALCRLKSPPFQAILVWKLSRFARNREDSVIYKALLRKRGVQVVSINEPIEDSPAGRLLEGIIEVIDEFYSDNLAQDVMRGMCDNAAKGYFCGGRAPYGYKAVRAADGRALRSKLELDESTAPIVRRMFNECLDSNGVNGVKEIAKHLNRDAIPSPKGNKWHPTSVYQVLTNEAVTGTLIWGKKREGKDGFPIRVENAWAPAVDKDTFARTQAILHSRGPKVTRPRCVTSQYLLGGMIRCAECGASMIGHAAKSGRFFYYRCGSALRRGPEACPSRWLPKSRIEEFVIGRIRDYILTEENLVELVRLTNEEIDTLCQNEDGRLEVLDAQLKDTDSRLDRLYEALETGKFSTDDLAPRMHALVARKAELQRARQEAKDAVQAKGVEIQDIKVMCQYVEDIRNLLRSASIMEQKAFLKSFVKNVDVSRSEVTVSYTLPMPPLNADKETVGVLAFMRSGEP